jgi:AcrR family transcriptional regulator
MYDLFFNGNKGKSQTLIATETPKCSTRSPGSCNLRKRCRTDRRSAGDSSEVHLTLQAKSMVTACGDTKSVPPIRLERTMTTKEKSKQAIKRKSKHDAILAAARELIYKKGYHETSFTDIADAANLPRGHFYYYFRSKEDILESVVSDRLEVIQGNFLAAENVSPDAVARLKYYVDDFLHGREMRKVYGCIMGSLAMELAKGDRRLLEQPRRLIDATLAWLEKQFAAGGRSASARKLAFDLLGRIQGACMLASVYGDGDILDAQFADIQRWLDSLFDGQKS